MKVFATSVIRQLDQYTIEHEPISSIDLMERAAQALFIAFKSRFSTNRPVCVFAGQGNNGGDALALSRLLLHRGYNVTTYLINPADEKHKLSPDCESNRKRLLVDFPNALTETGYEFVKPELTPETIIVDGLFGSGLSRPLAGDIAEVVQFINQSKCTVVSIDIPSGLMGEENKLTDQSIIVKANLTLSLQFPKLAFFFAENAPYVGEWKLLDIGLHPEAIKKTSTPLYYLEENDIAPLLIARPTFAHKGTFGHALIVSGSMGMAGASVLCAKAALRSGAGLVTVHGPSENRTIIQTAIPEAIFQPDYASDYITEVKSLETYNAVAIGPGIGKHFKTGNMLRNFLEHHQQPCVLDADALNIIAEQKEFLTLIPRNSILTPHPKEFERLFGATTSPYERMKKAEEAALEYGVIIVLKGAYTLIAIPNGKLFFNPTGNSGMATAGSGDVLTGIIVGLLAQGYSSEEAAKIGVFLHGRAGDLALKKESEESLIASDIVERLGEAFQSIKK